MNAGGRKERRERKKSRASVAIMRSFVWYDEIRKIRDYIIWPLGSFNQRTVFLGKYFRLNSSDRLAKMACTIATYMHACIAYVSMWRMCVSECLCQCTVTQALQSAMDGDF